MARRIEIELTSDRGDGTWTWRAAGARQPKGTLDAALLPSPASVGDVLRAEVEGFLDGLTIVAVLPPKAARAEPEKLELLSRRSEGPLVTTRVARTPRTERRDGRDRRPPREGRDHRDGRDNRDGRDRRDGRDGREGRDRRTAPRPAAKVEAKPRPKRLRPGKAHRNALLESLPPEQRPIAEQLFQGGIPAVRQAIEKQNEELKAEGKSQVSPEPLLEVAEKLRHRAQTALWRDRADAALASIDDLDLRDLRSVVNAAGDAGRDAEARTVAEQLREALANRVEKEQAAWVDEVAENLREGRVVRALRLSSRPPKAGSPLPPDLAGQLIQATEASLTAETGPQRWATVLDALAYSPIRRRVVPHSLPTKVGPDLRTTIARFGVQLPEIAHIFDIEPEAAPARERTRTPRRPPRKAAERSERPEKRGAKPTGERDKAGKPAKPVDTGTAEQADTPVDADTAEQADTPVEADMGEQADTPVDADTAEQADTPVEAGRPEEADTVDAGSGEQADTVDADTPAEADTAEQADTPATGEATPAKKDVNGNAAEAGAASDVEHDAEKPVERNGDGEAVTAAEPEPDGQGVDELAGEPEPSSGA
jgi:hypothetical protein